MTSQVAPPPQHSQGMVVAMVTGQDLLAQFNHLSESQARIESKVDGIPRQVTELAGQTATNTRDISEVRQRLAFMAGIGTVVALLLSSGLVVALLTHTHH